MTSSGSFSISCADCALRCSQACDDCVVTFVLQTEDQIASGEQQALVLDLAEHRVMRWFANAGLIPDLQFDQAG